MEAPAVSIIMPAYNAEGFIRVAVESALAQTFQNFELMVIDDGSADSTVTIIEEYALKDPRVILLKSDRNLGVAAARNNGILCARGKWIAFLDSDDLWRKDKLEKQMAFFRENPEAVISYTASSFIDLVGNAYGYVLQAEPIIDYKRLLRMNLMSCSSVMVRRDVMPAFETTTGQMHEDYAAWLKILRTIPYAYGIDEPLLIYRLSKNSKSGNRVRSAKMIYASYRHVGYSALNSALLMLRYSLYSIKKRLLINIT